MNIGKLFVFGFKGTEPTKEIIDFIKNDGLGGVILFRRNIESVKQLKNLTENLQDAAGGGLFIGIDQEGGRVFNLPKSIIDVPSMEKLGNNFTNEGSLNDAYNLGLELGEKLLELGINIDFAPVLDVHTNPKNPIIGNRSFSSDPEVVAKLGCAMIKGMTERHLISCGKHFPGHGDTGQDSHCTLPRLGHGRKRLDEIELVPFKSAIEEGLPALMSAHVIYSGVDSKNPATLSKKIMTELLRGELGFEGVLFTDDLEMRAITDCFTPDQAAVKAISAGCDIALICNSESYQKAAISAVKNALAAGDLSDERFQEALDRIDKVVSVFR